MGTEYIHELKREVRSISGSYQLEREGKIELDMKTVLYAVGTAVVDSACCGTWGCQYAIVPGYVTQLKARQTDHGLWVSEVDPIKDKETQQKIAEQIKEKELVLQVQFL
ncbi:MAG: hypothetical protein JRJ15_08775 [Deltaproteobacteria bacterium]|nr:hypothetical protein [Deltaproteobacteria bacterium]